MFSVSFKFIPFHSRFLRRVVWETEYFLIANSMLFRKVLYRKQSSFLKTLYEVDTAKKHRLENVEVNIRQRKSEKIRLESVELDIRQRQLKF